MGYPYQQIDIALDVTAPASVASGDTLTFAVTVRNESEVDIRDAAVGLVLPEELTLLEEQSTCRSDSVLNVPVCTTGSILHNEEVIVPVAAAIDAPPGTQLEAALAAKAAGGHEATICRVPDLPN